MDLLTLQGITHLSTKSIRLVRLSTAVGCGHACATTTIELVQAMAAPVAEPDGARGGYSALFSQDVNDPSSTLNLLYYHHRFGLLIVMESDIGDVQCVQLHCKSVWCFQVIMMASVVLPLVGCVQLPSMQMGGYCVLPQEAACLGCRKQHFT
jgi:hypothetical protein